MQHHLVLLLFLISHTLVCSSTTDSVYPEYKIDESNKQLQDYEQKQQQEEYEQHKQQEEHEQQQQQQENQQQQEQLFEVLNVRHSKSKESQLRISILLNGTASQVLNISRDAIMKSLWAMQKIKLPLEKKLLIWKILKDNKPVRKLRRSLFELAGNILLSIPEIDLFNLNVSDWQIVDYFGALPGLSRRQSGVIGYALKKKLGNNLLQNTETINRIKGLICGFSPQDLNTIAALQFSQIGNDVFSNIGACTPRQKTVLLQIAMATTACGPPQVWNAKDTETLGLLLTAMDKDNLPRIRPEAMEGITPNTVKALSKDQLDKLTKAQVEYLSDLSLAVYRKIMGQPTSSMDYSKAAGIYLSMIKETPTLHRDNMIMNLISNGFDANSIYYRYETPLHYAVCGPSVSVAHELIKNGADVNAQDADRCTPLHEAVCTNNPEAISMLLYYGADVNLVNRNEYTPFVQGIHTWMCMYNLEVACWLLNHYDKFHGRFTSMENYLYLFRNPIDQPIDENKKLWLVTQIWSKFDHETMLRTKSMFLTSYILDSRFSVSDWKKGLFTMLDAPDVGEVMAYKFSILDEFEISHFEDVFSAFQIRDLGRTDRTAIVALWLSFGAQVSLGDILKVYYQYGMNEEMLLLIFSTEVPLLTLLFGLEEYYGTDRDLQAVFFYEFMCNVRKAGSFEMAADFICKSLPYFSWGPFMRLAIGTHCRKYLTEDDKQVLKTMKRTPLVGSLVEKARNLISRSIQRNIFRKRRKVRSPTEYHDAVDSLEVTNDVKDILNFKRPLYTFSD